MQANNIDEVIFFLEKIIEDSKQEKSQLGYFAALYHGVTLQVRDGINKKVFENNERMEKLDVIFANRYLQAYTQFKNNEKTSGSWEVAMRQSQKYWPIVLQHLLLGMHAHINLDLGIAAAQIAPGDKINGLKNDFDKINDILASLVASVERELSKVWPTLKLILEYTSKFDTFLINFSMKVARDGAWNFTSKLALLDKDELEAAIQMRDQKVIKMASIITNPGIIASFIFKIIRLGERGTIGKRIKWLEEVQTNGVPSI